jgi:hypothetical protein
VTAISLQKGTAHQSHTGILMSSKDLPQLPPTPPTSQNPIFGNTQVPSVSMVNATAFLYAVKLQGSKTFQIFLLESGGLQSVPTSDNSVEFNKIPEEYHKFADVFSKNKANTLAKHCPYDLKINLEENTSLPPGTIYSLSPIELETLCKFIDENLAMGFI